METVFDSEHDEPLVDELSGLSDEEEVEEEDELLKNIQNSEVRPTVEQEHEGSVQLKTVDLGAEIGLVKQLKQLEGNESSTVKAAAIPEREEHRKRQVIVGQLRRAGTYDLVPIEYVNDIVSEVFSDKFRDWHFITNNCKTEISEEVRDILMLLRDYGVSSERVETLKKLKIRDPQYDNMGTMLPVRQMLDDFQELYTTVVPHAPSIDIYCKIFILFILDRKIYDSYECDSVWCTCMLKVLNERLTTKEFIQIYRTLVEPNNYFIHYRLLKLIPVVKENLLEQVISPYNKETLINIFNSLLDNEKFKELLYYLLLVVGCDFIPFGTNNTLSYFMTCITDIYDGSTSVPEISIIRNYLQMFMSL